MVLSLLIANPVCHHFMSLASNNLFLSYDVIGLEAACLRPPHSPLYQVCHIHIETSACIILNMVL
jgi:hypothetical protein